VRLTHVRLFVDDYAACFGFHRDVLGFEATFGDARGGYADFRAGGGSTLADRAIPTEGP
jgi:catechol 2,3-dioxygenase-like lactoylglutathione lyase family enzyme